MEERQQEERKYVMLAAAWTVLIFLAGTATGLLMGHRYGERPESVEDVETRTDTVGIIAPDAARLVQIGQRQYVLPRYYLIRGSASVEMSDSASGDRDSISLERSCAGRGGKDTEYTAIGCRTGLPADTDSVAMMLPEIQRHYSDSLYEAWVSGPLDPRLDSVRIYARTTTVTKREWKPPKRWHVGVTAGYGYGTKGFQPYIGIGVTYSIFSF